MYSALFMYIHLYRIDMPFSPNCCYVLSRRSHWNLTFPSSNLVTFSSQRNLSHHHTGDIYVQSCLTCSSSNQFFPFPQDRNQVRLTSKAAAPALLPV